MITVTKNDLKELKDLINLKFQQMDSRFDRMETKILLTGFLTSLFWVFRNTSNI